MDLVRDANRALDVAGNRHVAAIHGRLMDWLSVAEQSLCELRSCNTKMWFGRREMAMSVTLVVLTAAVYSQVVDFDFVVWDDNLYVYENPPVRAGLTADGLCWALTASHASNWHPLTWLSHMLDVQLAGVEQGVWLHHATSVLFHLANTVLLFVVLRLATTAGLPGGSLQRSRRDHAESGHKKNRTKQKPKTVPTKGDRPTSGLFHLSESMSFWAAAWVAAMFALHPLHVESVAWIAERKDVLSTFFGLLTILAYVVYARRAFSWTTYLPILMLYALGLLSKPILVTWPLLLLLLDFWPLRRVATGIEDFRKCGLLRTRIVVEKIPLLALAMASSVVTFFVQWQSGAVRTWDEMPIGYRVANSLLTYVVYLRQTFWPVDLAFFYPIDIHQRPMLGLQVAGAGLLLALLTGISVWQRRNRPYLVVGWFWFLITLLPVIGLVQVGGQMHADRYMYIPQIGLLLIVAWLTAEFATSTAGQKAIGTIAIGSVVICSVLTWRQVGTWQNNTTLASHALAVTQRNALAHYIMGVSLRRADQPDAAMKSFREAIRLNPRDTFAAHDLAVILFQRGNLDEAFRFFQETVKRDPSFARGFEGLAAVEERRGNYQQALPYARRAAELDPDDFQFQLNLAIVMEKQGDWEGAAEQYKRALTRHPVSETANAKLASGYLRLAAAHTHLNQLAATERDLRKALTLDPRNANVHSQLGLLASQRGKPREAIDHCRRALQIDSQEFEATNTLAWLLATQRDPAIRNGEEAVRLMEPLCKGLAAPPAALLDTLAASYAAVGRFEEAVATAGRALQIAESSGDNAMAEEVGGRLKQYRRREAIYEG